MGRIDSFENLGCLVTGASSGIGRDVAVLLAREGARVVVTARREERLQALCEQLRAEGAPEAHLVDADLDDPAAPAAIAQAAERHLGDVDVLVNNAGFAVPGTFANTDLPRTLSMVRVNVSASLDLAHRLLPGMISRDRGGLLTVASVAGYQAAPYQAAYAGTKAFLLNWSASVHQEYAHTNVAITSLNPGVTDTEFFEAAGYRKLSGFLDHRMPSMKVARAGVRALRRGRMEVVPGLLNKTIIFVQRALPRRFVASCSRRVMGGRPPPVRKG